MFRRVLVLLLASAAGASAQPPAELWPLPGEECPPVLLPCPCPDEQNIEQPAAAPAEIRSSFRMPENTVLRWNAEALAAIRRDRTPPPVAARTLAMVHVAVYDAVNAVTRTHRPIRVQPTAPAGASAEAAAAAAAYRTLTVLYPRQSERLEVALTATLATRPDSAATRDGFAVGRAVADEVIRWRAGDSVGGRGTYTLKPGAGNWRPTPPEYRAALLPGWADVPGFAIRSAADFRPPPPPSLTSDAFADTYRRVMILGAARSTNRTPDQTEVATFWADGEGTVTPPGHWNRIAASAAAARGTGTAETARVFALLNMALADAALVCWDGKYRYDFWRPVTAIREGVPANPAALPTDPDWLPLLPTPPFPAYPSGHSTFSGAAAAVLAEVFGSDQVRFTSTSDGLPGAVRSFTSFSAAAEEAGMSRIYGGIHWDFDNREGLTCGRKLGEYVATHFCRPISAGSGDAAPASFAIRRRPPR